MSLRPLALAAGLALALISCSAPGKGKSGKAFNNDLAGNFGTFAVLDLRNGTLSYKAEIPDLTTSASYREELMVFRRLLSGSTQVGTPSGEPISQADELAGYGAASTGEFFLGVFEVTKAQMAYLSGSTPTAIAPAERGKPASDVSADQVLQDLSDLQALTGANLGLPTAAQWERACRSGASTLFAWGNQITGALPQAQAVAVIAGVSPAGAAQVGSKNPNAGGFYDMHGNIWEMTSESSQTNYIYVRGGSWRDDLLQARCANRNPMPDGVSHPQVGARLVFHP